MTGKHAGPPWAYRFIVSGLAVVMLALLGMVIIRAQTPPPPAIPAPTMSYPFGAAWPVDTSPPDPPSLGEPYEG